MQQVAQAWLVLQLTNDPFLLGLVAAVQFLPVLVLGLFGGLIADCAAQAPDADRDADHPDAARVRPVRARGQRARSRSGTSSCLAALLGITNAVDMPTRQSFVVEMVGREDVANAVALNSAMFNAARIVGPAVAGLTIGAFDISVAFLINGLSFLAVIVGLRADARRGAPGRAPARCARRASREVRTTLAEGLRYVRRTEVVLLATIVVGLASRRSA